MTDKEIARTLSLSPKTVSHHVSRAMRKLDAASRREALRRLGENPLGGPIPIPPVEDRSSAVQADERSSGAEPPIRFRRLPPTPTDWRVKTALVGFFAFVAALIAMGAVSMVTGLFDLISVHAPETAL